LGRVAIFALVLATATPAFVRTAAAQPSEPGAEPSSAGPRAMDTEADRTAAARALFEEGMRAVDAGDWQAAVDRLRRSHELRPSPVVRYNLALALIEVGGFVAASEHLRAVMRATGEGTEAHRIASERLEAILPRLGRLLIAVTGASETVETRLDGGVVPDALVGVPQPADPGRHRVSIHRDGQELGAAEVTVESGRQASVALEAPPPPPEPERSDMVAAGGVETQWWFWTLIAVLAVGAGVGVGLAVWSESNNPQDAWLRGDDGRVHMTLVEVPW